MPITGIDELVEGDSPREWIAGAFSALRGYSPELERLIVDYILGDSPRSVLSSLSNTDRAALKLWVPESDYSGDQIEWDRFAAVRPGWDMRHYFANRAMIYREWGAIDRADDPMLIRLGSVLALSLRSTLEVAHVPRAVLAVLSDATNITYSLAASSSSMSAIGVDRLRSLLTVGGTRADAADGLLIELLIGSSTSTVRYGPRGLQTVTGTVRFARENLPLLRHHMEHFDLKAHYEVLRLAAFDEDLAAGIADWFGAYVVATDQDLRTLALAALQTVPAEVQLPHLVQALDEVPAAQVPRVLLAIERVPDAAAALLALQGARTRTAKGKRGALVEEAIQRLAMYELAPLTAPEVSAQPSVPGFERFEASPVNEAARGEVLDALGALRSRMEASVERARRSREKVLREHPEAHFGNDLEWAQEWVDRVDIALTAFDAVCEFLGGADGHPGDDALVAVAAVLDRVHGLDGFQRARAGVRTQGEPVVIRQKGVHVDPRAIADVLERSGVAHDVVESAVVGTAFSVWAPPLFAPDEMWFFMMEKPHTFDVILGLASGTPPQAWGDLQGSVIDILGAGPFLAQRYVPVLSALALGDAKTHRIRAQTVLDTFTLSHGMIEQSLLASSASARRTAVDWAVRLGGPWALDLLRSRLSGERDELARAVLLAGVDALGGSISESLSPQLITAEATAALPGRLPAALDWFDWSALPEARFADGSRVPAVVLQWWVVLANRLGDPAGAGLIPLYLRALDEESRAQVGRAVLGQWLQRDAEASSATKEKGMLALAVGVPGGELVRVVGDFMRQQHLRRVQIESLITMLSMSDDPEALQLLLATARRHRTESVQRRARERIDVVAARRGWTAEQLGDRTIPDCEEEIVLDYGARVFTARLGSDALLRLFADDGSPVPKLPAPRAADNAELAAGARAALAAAKKQLAAVSGTQRDRLYDAMCVQREWTVEEWTDLLWRHPVMRRLLARLVWQTGVGDRPRCLRPSLEGEWRDVDGAVVPAPTGRLALAHGTLCDDGARWAGSFVEADGPLFDQFTATAPPLSAGALSLHGRDGAQSETFRVRTRASARSWRRGETGDGATFDHYRRDVGAAGLSAVLSFSGSSLPEESIPAEIGDFSVCALRSDGRLGSEVALGDVPPVLLAELYADYLFIGEPAEE